MIKKQNVKSFVSGAVVATMLMSTGVFAQTYKKQLNAVYNDIKIIIDGVRITPKDADGKRVDPFVVEGTTYLPVRALSEALGQPVKWDKSRNAVVIGKEVMASGNIGITELIKTRPNYDGDAKIENIDSFEVLQKTQSGENTIYDGDATFLLNGDFKRLTGKFAIPDDGYSGWLHIETDDKRVFDTDDYIGSEGVLGTFGTYGNVVRGSKVIPVDIDLIGVEKISISVDGLNGRFFNVEFEPINK